MNSSNSMIEKYFECDLKSSGLLNQHLKGSQNENAGIIYSPSNLNDFLYSVENKTRNLLEKLLC